MVIASATVVPHVGVQLFVCCKLQYKYQDFVPIQLVISYDY